MGRKNNQKILKGYWRSRRFINRKIEETLLWKKEKIVKFLISCIYSSSSILISKIEYHYISYNKLNIIIYGTAALDWQVTTLSHPIIRKYLEKLFNKKINLLFINLSYPYLDAQILAQYILYKYSIVNKGIQKINSIVNLLRIINKKVESSKFINGIRIEIKGLSGKMLMSKKLIKSVGINQFNSSNSIIEYGFAKSLNKKGIIGIKVWINYTPIKG